MRFRYYMTLGATLLFVTAASGATWGEAEPWFRGFPPACTPEAQACLDKLEARLRLHAHSAAGIEQALLELQETDPGCALLLRSVALTGF
jgi:hypothetical protein